MDETLTMLKDLTDAPGVSGFEEPVRRVMRRYLEPLGEILTDNLGSIVGRKAGKQAAPQGCVVRPSGRNRLHGYAYHRRRLSEVSDARRLVGASDAGAARRGVHSPGAD